MARKRTDRKQSGHLSNEKAAAFVEGKVSPKERKRVVAHLADCTTCRELTAQVAISHGAVLDPKPRRQ